MKKSIRINTWSACWMLAVFPQNKEVLPFPKNDILIILDRTFHSYFSLCLPTYGGILKGHERMGSAQSSLRYPRDNLNQLMNQPLFLMNHSNISGEFIKQSPLNRLGHLGSDVIKIIQRYHCGRHPDMSASNGSNVQPMGHHTRRSKVQNSTAKIGQSKGLCFSTFLGYDFEWNPWHESFLFRAWHERNSGICQLY